jgi:NitT/TauT family transport system permease protein
MLIPVFVVWFGFGYTPKIVLVVVVILIMVTLNVYSSIREVSGALLGNARILGASRIDLIRHVYGPSVALWTFGTARLTVGYALNAVIAAEFIGTNVGIGALITIGQNAYSSEQIFAALALVAALAIIVDGLLSLVERRAVRWMPSGK